MRIFLSGDTHSNWRLQLFEEFSDHKFYDPSTCSDMPYAEMARVERQWIDESDIIFAYLSESNPYGYGTVFEVGYAVANQKPIIYVDEKQVSSSKWVAEHVGYAFVHLPDGIEKLRHLLRAGDAFIADSVVAGLRRNDFRSLISRELDDKVVAIVAEQIRRDAPLCGRLMLASNILPREWFDWNLGYLVRHFEHPTLISLLRSYSENLYHSEGVAWALGVIGNDDEAIIQFLQDQCRKCVDYDAWWCAAHSLEQLNGGDAVEILKRTLRGIEWLNIDHCIAALGERPATIGILRSINRQNVDRVVRAALNALQTYQGRRLHNVIWLLERLRLQDPEIIDALTNLRASSAEGGSSISHRVTEALGVIAHPAARELLERDLQDAAYFRTRALAARGLGLIGDPKSLPVLERSLVHEQDGHVLSAISEAIDEARDPDKIRKNKVASGARWLENGMIIDESNKWYWSPDIYERFSKAEDPQSISFNLAIGELPPTIDVLVDLASGTGRFINEILRAGRNPRAVTAVDRSPEMTEFLRKKFSSFRGNTDVREAALDSLPIESGTADVVVSSWGFPSKIWDSLQAKKELSEVYRILRPGGLFVTVGWDEDFTDEMTEIWYKFVLEPDCYFDSLAEYRRRRRSKISSPRNCGLSFLKKRLSVPVRFSSVDDAAFVMGHLFGYSAGAWVLQNDRREFQMGVSITKDTKEQIGRVLVGSNSQ